MTTMRELLNEAAGAVEGHKFSLHFLLTEWEQVVDAWQLEPGKPIATWRGWAARRGCRKPASGAVVDLRACSRPR